MIQFDLWQSLCILVEVLIASHTDGLWLNSPSKLATNWALFVLKAFGWGRVSVDALKFQGS